MKKKSLLFVMFLISISVSRISKGNTLDSLDNDHIYKSNQKILILNPYKDVNWSSVNQFKTNLHTHTTQSDGSLYPQQVVDMYHMAGYKILSITDHSTITFPWTSFSNLNNAYENRDPELFGMLAVEGNELSDAHHIGSYITAVPGGGADLDEAFTSMTRLNGLGAFKHPGRYWNIKASFKPGELYSIDWYQDYYQRFPALVGMELFNMGDRYPDDRILWDELLTRMMPERPVWGHANDDMHTADQLFKNYNFKLMPELSIDEFRKSMVIGASFFVHEPNGDGNSKAPRIDSITVNSTDQKIIIHAVDFNLIEWISGVSGKGTERKSNILAHGDSFDFNEFDKNYIRAVISNEFGYIYTQPFGFTNSKPTEIDSIEIIRNKCSSNVKLSIAPDNTANEFHWVVPGDVTILSGMNTHSIVVDFANYSGKAEVQVYKSNPLGVSNIATSYFEIDPLPSVPTIQWIDDKLISNAEKDNQWYDLTGLIYGETSQTFKPTRDGDYFVIVTLSGCKSNASNTISIVSEKAAILKNQELALLFPNPFTNEIVIDPVINTDKIYFEIINTVGRIVVNGTVDNPTRIQTGSLPKGIYFIRLDNGIETRTMKIIKN
jgi:hypothetical protein